MGEHRERCASCKRNWAEFSYEVDPENPKRVCHECVGKYEPKELNARLGLREIFCRLILIVPSFLIFN